MNHLINIGLTSALLLAVTAAAEPENWTDAEIATRLHAPVVAADNAAGMTLEKAKSDGLALYEKSDEALFFMGSGGGGLKNCERPVVEGCTFVLDFQEGDFEKWDIRRCAIYVEGDKEVEVRNCVFVSRTLMSQEFRRTVGSFIAYDCQKVQVEDCFFAGRTTGWRGHVLVFCCGPTTLRNIEVRGLKQGDQWACGGGLWVPWSGHAIICWMAKRWARNRCGWKRARTS